MPNPDPAAIAQPAGESLTLEAGLAQFSSMFLPSRNYSERTRREYHDDIADLVRFLASTGKTTWRSVGLWDLQSYLAELDRRQLAPASRNRKSYAIKTFFRFLNSTELIPTNPASGLIPPAVPRKERRFLTESEYQALLAQIRTPRDRAIVELFLQTGLRLNELAGLTLADVELPRRINKDPDNVGLLRVHRKGGKVEVLPINWKACEALASWLGERRRWLGKAGEISESLFISKFKASLTPRSIQRAVEKYLAQAGIRGATVHSLRHTMATHYLAKGGDLKSVQEMLGHESLATTQIYVGLAKKVQRRMVQELAL